MDTRIGDISVKTGTFEIETAGGCIRIISIKDIHVNDVGGLVVAAYTGGLYDQLIDELEGHGVAFDAIKGEIQRGSSSEYAGIMAGQKHRDANDIDACVGLVGNISRAVMEKIWTGMKIDSLDGIWDMGDFAEEFGEKDDRVIDGLIAGTSDRRTLKIALEKAYSYCNSFKDAHYENAIRTVFQRHAIEAENPYE